MYETRAAVMRALGRPMVVEPISVREPGEGEVLVRMGAAGICGSDVHVRDGRYPVAIPGVGGHEGAGHVEAVGPGVSGLEVGDLVVQTFVGPCGHCDTCRQGLRTFCSTGRLAGGTMADGTHRFFDATGEPLGNHLGLGSFSALTVTPRQHLVKIPADVPVEVAALVSCGVATGVGAAVNVAGVQPGQTVVVVGFGGVGASAVMGAVLAGAARVVVVDVNPAKEALANSFGATHYIDARNADVARSVADISEGGGAHSVLLTPLAIRREQWEMAVDCCGPGGVVVEVGGAHDHDVIPVPPWKLMPQKSIVGTTFGGPDPTRDARRWIDLYRAGRLPIDRLVTRRYDLDDINAAFDDLEAGRNLRGVIVF